MTYENFESAYVRLDYNRHTFGIFIVWLHYVMTINFHKKYLFYSMMIHAAFFVSVFYLAINQNLLLGKKNKNTEYIQFEIAGTAGLNKSYKSASNKSVATEKNASNSVKPVPVVGSNKSASKSITAPLHSPIKSLSQNDHTSDTKPIQPTQTHPSDSKHTDNSDSVDENSPVSLDDISTPHLSESLLSENEFTDDDKNESTKVSNDVERFITSDVNKSAQDQHNIESLDQLKDQLNQDSESTLKEFNNQLDTLSNTIESPTPSVSKLSNNQQGNASDAVSTGDGDAASSDVDGNGNDVGGTSRRLEDLRQIPGNEKPQYSTSERMRGQAGTIIMSAYVTKQGSLTNFKMSQSTGYRNLDLKTLKALKKWRFYPGQEGWVEIPIIWDLKGGAQPRPTLLKRR